MSRFINVSNKINFFTGTPKLGWFECASERQLARSGATTGIVIAVIVPHLSNNVFALDLSRIVTVFMLI